MKKHLILWLVLPMCLRAVSFEEIKNHTVRQYELSDIMMDLGSRNELALIERWRTLAPGSFRGLDFIRAYMLAADRHLKNAETNQALDAYVRAYQHIGRHSEKSRAAYMASFLLYAADKRPEALFYINRGLELASKNPDDEKKMLDLKRRITWRYFSRMDNLPDNAVSAIAFDDDDVWIGMWSGGLARYIRSAAEIEIFTPKNTALPSSYVRDILVQPERVWVAMHPGLAVYHKKTASWQAFPEFSKVSFKRLIESEGSLYAAALYKGIYASSNGGRSWVNIVPGKTVLDMVMVGGKLFAATAEQGVYVYENGQLRPFLPQLSVKSFLADENPKRLWMGTYGEGLFLADIETGRILKHYTAEDLGSGYIETLARVDGVLWAGTLDSGAAYFDGKNWERFGLRKGLPGAALTTMVREKEYLWFGTLSGGIGMYLFKEISPPEAAR